MDFFLILVPMTFFFLLFDDVNNEFILKSYVLLLRFDLILMILFHFYYLSFYHLNFGLQLNLSYYLSFVDDALKEILPQNIYDSNFVVFNHKIPPQFISTLILNLVLSDFPTTITTIIIIFFNFFYNQRSTR